MRVLKNKAFSRFTRKEGITDDELRAIVPLLEENRPDANLGGDVFKMRVPRPNDGKSGGYRVIVLFRKGERTFFVHGFAKSNLVNISDKQLRRFKRMAKYLLSFSEKNIEAYIKAGEFTEIKE
jgi:hypothetical protein